MQAFSPRDIAAIQARFRRFNSDGGSNDFTPPQNTPPNIPLPRNVQLVAPKPVKAQISKNTPIENQIPKLMETIATNNPKITKFTNTTNIKHDIQSVPILVDITDKLRAFQIEHVQNLQYAIQTNTVAFDGSDTGTGKTYTACALAKNRMLKLIVCCPKSVIPTWHKVANEIGCEISMIVNYETLKNGKYYPSLNDFNNDEREDCPYINIVREEVLDSFTQEPILNENGTPKTKVVDITWDFPEDTLVVFDEAHKGKNGLNASKATINSKMMVSIKPYLDKAKSIFGLFLSATITDKLDNFDVISFMLGMYKPYLKKTYNMFLRDLTLDNRGQLEAIHAKIYPKLGSRMNIKAIRAAGSDVFKQNIVKAIAYEIDQETSDLIEAEHVKIRIAMKQLRNKMLTDSEHPFVVILRARQRIELLKVPLFTRKAIQFMDGIIKPEDLIDGEIPEGFRGTPTPKAIMIFVSFNESIALLTQKFREAGIDLSKIDYIRGKQTPEERTEIIRAFQHNETHIVICNIQAGGIAISLHDLYGKQRVSLISPTWSSIDLKQVMGRGYRADALSDMIQFIIYAKSPNAFDIDDEPGIEEYICANVNAKMVNVALINDGDLQNYQDFTSKKYLTNVTKDEMEI